MKHLFVINPRSFVATGGCQNIIAEIASCFSSEESSDYKVHISRYARDAIAIVHHFIAAYPADETVRIYAVGGDGILFECLNGMVDFPNAELTSIPYGNANDFARVFGEGNHDKFRDIKSLLNAPSRPIDIIHCGSNYALNGMSVGIIGQTIIYANNIFPHIPPKLLRRFIGQAYTLSGVFAAMKTKVVKQVYELLIDGEDFSGQICNIHIQNSAVNGGSLTPSPYAKPNDGILNVLLAKIPNAFEVSRTIGDYNKGHFEKHDYYEHHLARVIEIKSEEILSVEIDGEGFYASELKIEIIPNGIKVVVPAELDFADYSHRSWNEVASQPTFGLFKYEEDDENEENERH
ncbi:MAG: hypothetical protein FWG91_01905 [Lachnospiraceae bacterium]|nr:hypothetical protein [Lachnospiraceae bacterium]